MCNGRVQVPLSPMKKTTLILLALCASVFVLAAPQGPRKDDRGEWVFDTYTFTAQKGDWSQARSWMKGTPPAGELPRVNINGGSTVTIARPEPLPLAVMYLGLGKAQPTTVVFEKNARLTVGKLVMPTLYITGSQAEFLMKGGELSVGELKDGQFNGPMGVGIGATTSGGARFILSGGKLTAGILVGSSLPKTNTGVFVVQGSQAVCALAKYPGSTLDVRASGTLEFVLDANGVSTIDARHGSVEFRPGSTLRIDGTAFAGNPQTITLIQGGYLRDMTNLRAEVVGFPPAYRVEVATDKNRVLLKIAKAKQ